LVGHPAAASVSELRKVGLKPNSIPEPVTDPSQAGMVIAQDPPAGEFVPANTRVRIEIGDHSLFDARQYDSSPPPPEFDVPMPAAPEPLDLSAVTAPWISEDQLSIAASDTAPEADNPEAFELESRWESLGGEPAVDYADDVFAEEAYPVFPGEIFEDKPTTEHAYYNEFDPHRHEPRWTRKQRNRIRLAVGILILLAGLIAYSHLEARTGTVPHKPSSLHANVPQKRAATHARRAPEHVPTADRSSGLPAFSPASNLVVPSSPPTHVNAQYVSDRLGAAANSRPSTASSASGVHGDLSPTVLISPPPNHPSNLSPGGSSSHVRQTRI
jgi:PASTA domain